MKEMLLQDILTSSIGGICEDFEHSFGALWNLFRRRSCVSRRSLQLTLALVCWCWLGWFLLVSVGELIFDLFLTSSNNLTATVESNAATVKKNKLFRRRSTFQNLFQTEFVLPTKRLGFQLFWLI